MSDDTNQNIGSISPDVEYDLVETDKGNGIIVAQLPSVRVSFHAFTPGQGHEKEVKRTRLSLTQKDLEAFQDLPDTHTLSYDKISKSVISKPKTPMPRADTKGTQN